MNSHYIISILSVLTLLSCNDKVSEELDLQNDQSSSQNSVCTYDMYFESDIASYDGMTRAVTASDWVEGDVVYLRFMGNNHVYGKAEYISSSNKWRVTCDKPLVNATDANCSVWCGDGVNPGYDEVNKIYYDYMTEAYLTESGKYSFSNNSIYVNASMQPVGFRLRFKGQAGTVIQVNKTTGFDVYNIINHTSNYGFSKWSYSFELKVGSNGYTDYFIAKASSECTSISIKNKTTGEEFIHDFNSYTLNIGESGCFTIPSTSDLHGWYATENGHAYVDLGLPSGTRWATCNIGATKPEEYGGYYAWGETEEKDYYNWSTYIHCDGSQETYHYIGDDIAGTEYDVAHVKWGGKWRMPSLEQIEELVNNCTQTWETLNGMNGILVTGPNGETVFLPAAGTRIEDNHVNEGIGDYESSTCFGGKGSYLLKFSSDDWFCTSLFYNYGGYSVRAVYP